MIGLAKITAILRRRKRQRRPLYRVWVQAFAPDVDGNCIGIEAPWAHDWLFPTIIANTNRSEVNRR